MGFIKNERLPKWEFKHFKISHSLNEPAPNHVETQVHNPSTNKPMTKYIEKFDAVEGVVTDAEWYDRKDDAGQRYLGYLLTLDIGNELISLDFPYKKSAAAYRVLTRHGPNVDWSKRIKFSAWKSSTPQGKDATGVCFWQRGPDGEYCTVKSAHTKDSPNGCPPPEETMEGLSWAKAERWLKAQFDAKCVPAIKAAAAKYLSESELTEDSSKRDVADKAQGPRTQAAGAGAGAGEDGDTPYDESEPDDTIPF